ncbi:hypothetical protein BpHYR1_033502 [Brachionus plicatilis]|uniref:Trehalase n=1 Tax=Brachionus plicatilis TaxID=10195 RepID=A0A3M7QX99_BRAPC|nr:hypothetical protein BpHYR1_033502 [Brachionus plicatilis]
MAAAESGYDFSSKWFKDPMNMATIHTTDLILMVACLYVSKVVSFPMSSIEDDTNPARAKSRFISANELKKEIFKELLNSYESIGNDELKRDLTDYLFSKKSLSNISAKRGMKGFNCFELSQLKGDEVKAKLFKLLAAKRCYAINKLLWSKENCCWSDYNIKSLRLLRVESNAALVRHETAVGCDSG